MRGSPVPKKDRYYGSNIDSFENAAKTLLANIRFSSIDQPLRTIVVTSSVPDEGKSTISLALSKAIATSGKTCLLVEADMHRRTLAGRMQVHPPQGLYAVLSRETTLESAVVASPGRGLFFLDAEPSIPNPSDILASQRFKALVALMRERYDYVVFDTPPIGAFVDAAVVGSLADATLLVVRENHTKRSEVKEAYDQLKQAGANVAGIVMNHCAHKRSSYLYSDYYEQRSKRSQTSSQGSRFANKSRASHSG